MLDNTTNPVSIESYRGALRQLVIGWRTHTKSGLTLDAQRLNLVRLIYPWVAQTHRFGDAALHLEKKGFNHEGHVLTRSALEYALMAHWASVTGDAALASRYAEDTRLLKAMVREARGGRRDLQPSTWNLDQLEQLVEAREPAGADEDQVVQKVQQVCERLGLGNQLYPAYRVHSWFAHPTTHAVGIYMEELPDGRFAIRDKPKDASPGAVISMMAHCVLWARRVLDDMTPGRPHEEWLDELAAGIMVRPRLPEPIGTKGAAPGGD